MADISTDLTPERRMQIMGHSRGDIFTDYLNELVDTDTQSVYLGTPTRDALIKLSTNSSITRDPSAPQELTPAQKQSVEKDPELLEAEEDWITRRDELIAEYGTISKITDLDILQDYRQLRNKPRTIRKRLHKKEKDKTYKEHFDNVGDTIIEKNYRGEDTTYEPDTSSILPERKALAALEFQNRDVNAVPDEELVEDRIRSLELRLTLTRLAPPRRFTPRFKPTALADNMPFSEKLPGWSPTGLECPECLTNTELHPQARQYRYCNRYVLRDHLQMVHLRRMDFSKAVSCCYRNCSKLLPSEAQYLHHLAGAHGTQLPNR